MADEARNDDGSERAPRVLGDLLFADRSRRPPSEKEWIALVRSIATRDERALRELYERTHRLVHTLVLRIVQQPETADELTLEVFYDVWRRAPAYDASGGTVVGWLMNQARSRAIDRVRFEQRKKRTNPYASAPEPASACAGADAAVQREEQGRMLREALGTLGPSERRVIESAFFSELTHVEIAAHLNEPLGTVKTRIRSGLAKLRAAMTSQASGR